MAVAWWLTLIWWLATVLVAAVAGGLVAALGAVLLVMGSIVVVAGPIAVIGVLFGRAVRATRRGR